MRYFIKSLLAILVVIAPQASRADTGCKDRIVSGFVADTFYQNPGELVASFKNSPFNTVATTIAWSVVERKKGEVDLTPYFPRLDALVKAGYCLIVLMDTSGRSMRSDVAKLLVKDLNSIPQQSSPDWIGAVAPNSNAIDFFGGASPTLDFEDQASLRLVRDLYRTVLPKLQRRYAKSLAGVAPCITSECEIKYTQTGFKWQSYSSRSQQAFKNHLTELNFPASDMPIMNYGNHLSNGNPKPQPLFPVMQDFREISLRNYACTLTAEIRRAGIQSVGYFGQAFAFPDGIYATGVIERAADCFDVAAIDYNFFNGYGTENKPGIPQFLADYALTLGYKKVIVGLYMERFRNPESLRIDPRGYEVLFSALRSISPNPGILGVEIGNLTGEEFQKIKYVTRELRRLSRASHTSARKKVALFASIANSYLWQGEWSNNRQVMQDNLIATYDALRSIRGLNVSILTDAQMRERPWSLSNYDLIVLPHVTAMPPAARKALADYLRLGGKLMVDMRADEYRPDGSVQTDMTFRNMLGIGAAKAFEQVSLTNGVTIERQQQYVTGFAIAPAPGFKVAYTKKGGLGEGLTVQGAQTTVFGFLPLLVEGKAQPWARQLFESEVRRLLN